MGSSGSTAASRHGPRAGAAFACVALACLGLAGGASAATLDSFGGPVYNAGAGETNNLRLSRSGSNYVFTDAPGTVINATAPCSAVANVGTCPVGNFFQVIVNLEDMNDAGSVDGSVSGVQPRFTGGAGNDTLTGGPNASNFLEGDDGTPEGNDTITGGLEDDQLVGGDGNDTMAGAGGNDFFNPGDGNDVVSGGAGRDQFESDSEVFDGKDVFSGGTESDLLDLSDRFAAQTVTLNGVADDGLGCPGPGCEGDNAGADVEGVRSGGGNDLLIGNGFENDLDGGRGDDTVAGGGAYDELEGSDGNDVLRGEGGNDELIGEDGSDSLLGGGGDDYTFPDFLDYATDTLSGGPGIDSIGGGAEQMLPMRVDLDNRADDGFAATLITGPRDNVKPDVENLEGGPGNDVLIGSGRPNELDGLGGNDRLVGGKGPDALLGDRGNDRLSPGGGSDTVFGEGGTDRISARDRKRDEVSCGSAVDRVKADRADRLGADCDRVQRR